MVIWLWPWVLKVKFWKCCISGMGGLIDMERKGVSRLNVGPMLWLSTLTSPMNLTLTFQCQILKKLHHKNARTDWHRTRGILVDRVLYQLCDLELWSWPWIFKVKFWKCCISGMGGPITKERKAYESIGCYTYYVTWSYDFDLGFWRSNLKKALS